jgi:hypothetical protein
VTVPAGVGRPHRRFTPDEFHNVFRDLDGAGVVELDPLVEVGTLDTALASIWSSPGTSKLRTAGGVRVDVLDRASKPGIPPVGGGPRRVRCSLERSWGSSARPSPTSKSTGVHVGAAPCHELSALIEAARAVGVLVDLARGGTISRPPS